MRNAGVIECVVVETAKPFAARIIRPNPFLEPFLDAFLFLAGGFCRLRVDDGLLLFIEIIDRGCFEIEGVFNQFEAGVTVSAPIGRVGGRAFRLPIRVDMPGSERVDVADFHAGRNVEQYIREVLHVPWRQPRRAKTNVNFRGREVCRLDGFQCLDILGKTRVGNGSGIRDSKFFADIAGKILVIGFPLVGLRVEENDALQFRQEFLGRFIEQASHVVEIHASPFV